MENKHSNLRLLLLNAKSRLICSIAAAIIAFILLEGHSPSIRFLMVWSAASVTYLALAFLMMQSFNGKKIANVVKYEDDSQLMMYVITSLSCLISLAAIFLHIGEMGEIPLKDRTLGVTMTGATFFASWMVLQTAYALHYAHAYYANFNEAAQFPPLIFVGTPQPSYSDFFHFSLVIGMTCQTADIVIVESKIRNLVTAHSLLSFVFNATLLGLTMGLVGGLLG
ncbi:hypothetical protein B6A14_03600 [Polynucleobacter hirudinilacicola]|uniref:DUF1345 domain-containing protein n=1 Tax=Polynucleobacter hirudinilacicola TaxID=1743166 RepID=A0A210RZ91_9BURK|nr:DUF1345 domain-containing protein [Polynucleobacter hirudinilacicola]OWF66292.1 hypothetical protein B6A14_03600 [Polynucleobacter hirudinilacicola]